jgi:hypothetical protein
LVIPTLFFLIPTFLLLIQTLFLVIPTLFLLIPTLILLIPTPILMILTLFLLAHFRRKQKVIFRIISQNFRGLTRMFHIISRRIFTK